MHIILEEILSPEEIQKLHKEIFPAFCNRVQSFADDLELAARVGLIPTDSEEEVAQVFRSLKAIVLATRNSLPPNTLN